MARQIPRRRARATAGVALISAAIVVSFVAPAPLGAAELHSSEQRLTQAEDPPTPGQGSIAQLQAAGEGDGLDADLGRALGFDAQAAQADAEAAAASVTSATRTPVPVPAIDPPVVLRGAGWGHGVGMSQYGAYAMARAGRTHQQILAHYYQGTAVTSGASAGPIRVGLLRGAATSTLRAVSGSVTWRRCTPTSTSACPSDTSAVVATQPSGSTWTVRRATGGGWQLLNGGASVWSGGTAANTLIADHHGVTVEGYNPNRHQSPAGTNLALYRYGFQEFRADTSTTMYVVQQVPNLELYMRGLGEVPSSWGIQGPAALRAQAVAGRTYALRRFHARGLGLGSTDCRCTLLATPANQVYVGYSKEVEYAGDRWVQAVTATVGQIATYNGTPIDTFYSSSHSTRSENVQDSWAYGTATVPYLVSVSDPWSGAAGNGNDTYRSWARSRSNSSFSTYLSSSLKQVQRVRILSRTTGGTPRELEITGINTSNQPVTFRWSRPSTTRKPIAGANFRIDFGGVPNGIPGQQIRAIGFAPFTDDDGNTHEFNITRLRAAGITEGCGSATLYCPSRNVTRAEMATFLVRSWNGLDPKPGQRFSDTPVGATHTTAINGIADAGITVGCGGTRYCPTRSVTRAEMATFLVRTAENLSPRSGQRFSDVPATHTHAGAINALADAGITTGCGDGRYCPDRPVTRAEMASFLIRTLTLRP